jgi:hypothetical protein
MINSVSLHPLSINRPSDVLSVETQNKLSGIAQDKVDQATEAVTTKKNTLWQFALGGVYVNNQKEMINAYTMSSTGEKLYETSNRPSTLTSAYELMRHEYLIEKYSQLIPNKPSVKPEHPIEILPVEQLEKNNVNIYQSVQKPMDNSVLHLVA